MKEILFLFFFLNLLSNCRLYNIKEVKIDKDHDTELSVEKSSFTSYNYFYVKNTDTASSNTLYIYFLSEKNYINSVEVCYTNTLRTTYYNYYDDPFQNCEPDKSVTNYENNNNYNNDEKFYKYSYSNTFRDYFIIKFSYDYSYNMYSYDNVKVRVAYSDIYDVIGPGLSFLALILIILGCILVVVVVIIVLACKFCSCRMSATYGTVGYGYGYVPPPTVIVSNPAVPMVTQMNPPMVVI